MGKVKVDIGGLKELNKQIGRIAKEKSREIDATLEAAVKEMRRGAIEDAPTDEANLRRGIRYERKGNLQYELKSNAYYSVYMEFGTKARYQPIPGVDPSEFKTTGGKGGRGFYDSILEWVKRKNIAGTYQATAYHVKTRKASKIKRMGSKVDQQIEDEQTAFAIYLSIIRHGVKPHPFFFRQEEKVRPKLIRDIENVLND